MTRDHSLEFCEIVRNGIYAMETTIYFVLIRIRDCSFFRSLQIAS